MGYNSADSLEFDTVSRYVDVPGIFGVTVYEGTEIPEAKLIVPSDDSAWVWWPENIQYIVRNVRGVKPFNLSVFTGPLGAKNWLGLPVWVKLVVYPDEYEVKERVDPGVQEWIWRGLTKQKAKDKQKKEPADTGEWALDYTQPKDVFEILPGQTYTSLDFETDGKWKFRAGVTGLAVSNGEKNSWITDNYKGETGLVTVRGKPVSALGAPLVKADSVLRDVWERGCTETVPVFHSANYDIAVAKGRGWKIPESPEQFEDTLLLAFCTGEKWKDESSVLGLKYLARKYLSKDMRELKDFIPEAQLKRQGTLGADPVALAEYARADADATLRLLPVLKEREYSPFIYELEKKLVPIVVQMEEDGFPLDPRVLDVLIGVGDEGCSNLEGWFDSTCDWRGNLNSPQQACALIYDKLGVRVSEYGRSTSKEAMALLSWHPACKRVRAWRQLDDIRSQARSLMEQYMECGYAYSTFNPAGGSTGRFSSREPLNLQNKTQLLRKAFVSGDDYRLEVFRADYSQIELRIAAALSGDKTMLETIERGESLHKNLHKVLIEAGINVSYDKVKTFDFSLFYGGDVDRVMTVLGCEREQAEYVIEVVESAWVEAMAWRKVVLAETQANGGINHSIRGRVFLYPTLFSGDFKERGHAERTVVNKPIQGSGADTIKISMSEFPYLRKKYGAVMRLTVHDEITGTSPRECREEFKKDLREIMLEAEPSVPLDVEIGFGKNWKDAKAA